MLSQSRAKVFSHSQDPSATSRSLSSVPSNVTGPGRLARLRSVWVREARRVVCSCGLRYSSFIRLAPFGLPQPVTASYPAAAL